MLHLKSTCTLWWHSNCTPNIVFAEGIQFVVAEIMNFNLCQLWTYNVFQTLFLLFSQRQSLCWPQIHTCFTFAADPDFLKNDIRVKPDLDAHGALGDAGWYCIRAILWANNYELPKTVVALRNPILNEAGVILSCGASLHWEDGKVGTFHCSFLSSLTMDIAAIGTKGTLHVSGFVIPHREKEASFSTALETGFDDLVTCWVPPPSDHIVTTDLPQEALMVTEFSRLVGIVKNGSKPEKKWPILSRKTQLVIDAVKASINKGFELVHVE